MHEACSNASHTFFNAKEGNSVTVSQEEDHICFCWIGRFQQGISYSLWFQICQSFSGWCSLDPKEQPFYSSKLLLSAIYRQTSPWHVPSPHTPRTSKESCVRLCCNAWLPAENCVVFLVIFFLFVHWRPALKMTILSGGTAKPKYAIVNLTFNTLWSNWVRKFSVHPESSKRELNRRG